MNLLEKIQSDLLESLHNREKEKATTIRMLLATIANKKIKKKLKNANDLLESDIIDCITKNIKTLDQEIASLVQAGRDTSKQETERKLLTLYLPKQMSASEIKDEVAHAVFLTNKGEIKNPMQYLSQKLKGKADMKLVSQLVKDMPKENKEVNQIEN